MRNSLNIYVYWNVTKTLRYLFPSNKPQKCSDTQTETETDRVRQTERARQREREIQKERERKRETHCISLECPPPQQNGLLKEWNMVSAPPQQGDMRLAAPPNTMYFPPPPKKILSYPTPPKMIRRLKFSFVTPPKKSPPSSNCALPLAIPPAQQIIGPPFSNQAPLPPPLQGWPSLLWGWEPRALARNTHKLHSTFFGGGREGTWRP